jgi:hypothetical protein
MFLEQTKDLNIKISQFCPSNQCFQNKVNNFSQQKKNPEKKERVQLKICEDKNTRKLMIHTWMDG